MSEGSSASTGSSIEQLVTMFPLVSSLVETNCLSTALTLSIMSLIFIYVKQQSNKLADQQDRIKRSKLKPLPTPPKMPLVDWIVGDMHLLRDYQENPWDGLDSLRVKYGDVVGLKMGVHQMVLVSSYKIMREILLDKGELFANRPNFPRYHIIFGGDRENSLALCSWSGTHKDRRKFCKKGIAPNKFSSRNRLLDSIVFKHVAQYTRNSISEATKTDILFLTSDIFIEFLCSEIHSHSDPDYKKFVRGCDFVFWDINQSYLIDFLPYLSNTLGFFYLRNLKHETNFLRHYIDDKIFNPRLETLSGQEEVATAVTTSSSSSTTAAKTTNSNDESQSDSDYLNSILTDYLSKKNSMSLADYRVGFEDLLAGHAAVANILMRLLGHLSLKPEIQDLIYEEAKEIDIESLDKRPSMPIVEAAVQEALRLASSPIVPHVARENTSIGEYYVPEGTMVLFNLYHLNLSTDFWSDPLDFNPMRLIETTTDESDGITKKHKLNPPKHFMPFSQGPRQCLGFKMVETISIVTVSNLCKKYRIKADDEALVKRLLTPKGSLALNPDDECYKLQLYLR